MRKITAFLTALLLLSVLASPALAESFTGGQGWSVTFTAKHKLESDFRSSVIDETITGCQPGDDVSFTIRLRNESGERITWYMRNQVLYSLEDRSANAAAAGGGYSYELLYVDPAEVTRVLFSSDTVGGDVISGTGPGLHEAANTLDEYFFLDRVESGQTGRIVLNVTLDGETIGNDYQQTMTDLEMGFAVDRELPDESGEEPGDKTSRVAKTGDETPLAPYLAVMCASTAGVLLLGAYRLRRGKRRKEGRG